MTILVPPPPQSEANNEAVALELAVQRDATEWFIAAHSKELVLIPTKLDKLGNGNFRRSDLPARPIQSFRFIVISGGLDKSAAQKPKVTTDGIEREADFILLGAWDAQIAVGDHWRDAEDLAYEVAEILPPNGYETQAFVVKKGHG